MGRNTKKGRCDTDIDIDLGDIDLGCCSPCGPLELCVGQLKRSEQKRHAEREVLGTSLKLRNNKIKRLESEMCKAQDLVENYSLVNSKLDSELHRVKDKAIVKLHRKEKKLEKLNHHCASLAADLHEASHALAMAESSAHTDAAVASTRVRKLAEELTHAREKQEAYKEEAASARCLAQKAKLKHNALKDKNAHIFSHLKESQKASRHLSIEKQVVSDELAALRAAHEVAMSLNEELKCTVFSLKQTLKDKRALRTRESVVAKANDLYRDMRPYLGVVFVTEPWPVSSVHGTGVLLQEVKRGHAGYTSGLRSGDVITETQGKSTRSKVEFYAALYGVKPGDTLHMHIIRPSQGPGIVRSLNVTMGAYGMPLKQVLAVRRLAERNPANYTDSFDADVIVAGLEAKAS